MLYYMSSSPFPDPKTNQFNPSAWDFTTYFKYLNSILTYPGAQRAVVEFVDSVYLTTRTALTQWADTAYATSEIVAWASANVPPLLPNPQNWNNLQYYFGGIAVNTINPTGAGGTVNIGSGYFYSPVFVSGQASRSGVLRLGDGSTTPGGIYIGNGISSSNNVNILNGTGSTGIITLGSNTSTTNLNQQPTPLYPYLPVFYVANANNVTYGTKVGAVGQIIYSANNSTRFPGLVTDVTVTLSVGTWLLNGECFVSTTFSDRFWFGFNTVANDTNMFCGFGPTFGMNETTRPGGLRLNTIYTVTSGTPTIFLINRGYNYGMAISNRVLTATRIA